jgi:hypothetical protein
MGHRTRPGGVVRPSILPSRGSDLGSNPGRGRPFQLCLFCTPLRTNLFMKKLDIRILDEVSKRYAGLENGRGSCSACDCCRLVGLRVSFVAIEQADLSSLRFQFQPVRPISFHSTGRRVKRSGGRHVFLAALRWIPHLQLQHIGRRSTARHGSERLKNHTGRGDPSIRHD